MIKNPHLTFQKKAELLKDMKNPSKTLTMIAKENNIKVPTLSVLKKREFEILDKSGIDDTVLEWFLYMRERNVPIAGNLIKQKALKLAALTGETDFKASNGWLQKWKERHNIKLKRIYGERLEADSRSVEVWIQEEYKQIISKFAADEIYNADETGLYFKLLSNKTLCFANDYYPSGFKQIKIW